uniref:CCHC NOA-type domain-containing protein n=1 Tax=Ficedula albicollis TaxID=59894 RepID=A0A803W1T8_FICAL
MLGQAGGAAGRVWRPLVTLVLLGTGWWHCGQGLVTLGDTGDVGTGWWHCGQGLVTLGDTGDVGTGWWHCGQGLVTLGDTGDVGTGWWHCGQGLVTLGDTGDVGTGWWRCGQCLVTLGDIGAVGDRLVALRARVAVAELRAQDVSRAAELQLQGLRRQLEGPGRARGRGRAPGSGCFPRGRAAAAGAAPPAGGTGTWGHPGDSPGDTGDSRGAALGTPWGHWGQPWGHCGDTVGTWGQPWEHWGQPGDSSCPCRCPQQDKAQVQAQVTSLLGELRESQNRLERSRAEREHLERRARSDAERCQQLEEVTQGHQVQLDQLRLQVTNLETALRVERRGATEEKRKLVQLQAAYHHLFQEYDAHIKASLEGDKQSQVRDRDTGAAGDTEGHVPSLGEPGADIYRADFEAERAAREQLHGQREALQEELNQLRLRLGGDGARYAPPNPRGFGVLLPPPEEGPDLCCPKCQYKAPDMDTLQIHVMDCIK